MSRSFIGFVVTHFIFGGFAILMVWRWLPEAWAKRPVKRGVVALPLVGAGAIGVWSWTKAAEWHLLTDVMATLVVLTLLIEVALVLTLPFSALLRLFVRWRWKESERDAPPLAEETPSLAPARGEGLAVVELQTVARATPALIQPSMTRRALLASATVAPLALGGFAVGGLVTAKVSANIEEKPFFYEDLPAALDGLRILHLSDIHIGFSFSLRDLEGILEEAAEQRPDLILVTGDLSDRIPQLPDALKMIAAVESRYGALASVGNHEYFRGIKAVRRAHDRSDIPMLLNANHTIDVSNAAGQARLFIAGADDPVRMRGDISGFLDETVSKALVGRPDDAFTVLMSHRPRGFDAAAKAGVELTLSGHTHGGQFGLGGRSLFEPLRKDLYLWGRYRQGNSQLYTSSGVGHWFPFRAGCPTEAPIIVLRRGSGPATS